MTSQSKIVGNREFTWKFWRGEYFVTYRPLNKKTGLPWQASRWIYRGENPVEALRSYNAAMKAEEQKAGAR